MTDTPTTDAWAVPDDGAWTTTHLRWAPSAPAPADPLMDRVRAAHAVMQRLWGAVDVEDRQLVRSVVRTLLLVDDDLGRRAGRVVLGDARAREAAPDGGAGDRGCSVDQRSDHVVDLMYGLWGPGLPVAVGGVAPEELAMRDVLDADDALGRRAGLWVHGDLHPR